MLKLSLPLPPVLQAVISACHDPRARWVIESDCGFSRRGHVTHRPIGHPSSWSPLDLLYVGDQKIGEPILLGHIRAARPLGDAK